MKPTFQKQKTIDMEVNITSAGETTRQKPNKPVTRFIIVVVTLIFASGVVLSSVYFGKRLLADAYKEYHVIVHRVDGPTTNETWRFTDTEEEFETDDIKAIYDYKTALAAFALKRQVDNGFKDCYVTSFNISEKQIPTDVKTGLTSTTFEITEKVIILKSYEVTDIWLNQMALGERSRLMCDYKNLFLLKNVQSESSTISKRDTRACWPMFYSVQMVIISENSDK